MSADTPTEESTAEFNERRRFIETLLIEHAPLLAAIFRQRMKRHADDALQEFVSSILTTRLCTRLRDSDSEDAGRSLLVHAARDFCVDFRRRERRQRRAERNRVPRDHTPISVSGISNHWARQIFTQALERTKTHFMHGETPHYWSAFAARVSTPIATGNQPPPPDDLAAELGFERSEQLHQAVYYVKRRVRHAVNEVLLERAARDETDFDDLYTLFMKSI